MLLEKKHKKFHSRGSHIVENGAVRCKEQLFLITLKNEENLRKFGNKEL